MERCQTLGQLKQYTRSTSSHYVHYDRGVRPCQCGNVSGENNLRDCSVFPATLVRCLVRPGVDLIDFIDLTDAREYVLFSHSSPSRANEVSRRKQSRPKHTGLPVVWAAVESLWWRIPSWTRKISAHAVLSIPIPQGSPPGFAGRQKSFAYPGAIAYILYSNPPKHTKGVPLWTCTEV